MAEVELDGLGHSTTLNAHPDDHYAAQTLGTRADRGPTAPRLWLTCGPASGCAAQ